MIDDRAATRVSEWIAEAVAGGARLLAGGKRTGNAISPTVLVGVEPSMKVMCDEVFGPVVSIVPFDRIEDAIGLVNDSPWGLAGGIYTRSLDVALMAVRRLRTGVLNVNAPSRFRVEHVPYGGLKLSGWGKEGPRYAVQEMTEVKMVIVSAS
jgi:acyl-CoA reductase-like NAD-dependent aldehyde dehydrogenase